jgi:hypothetical protein
MIDKIKDPNCRRSVENRPVVVDSKPATKLVSYRAGVMLARRILVLGWKQCWNVFAGD